MLCIALGIVQRGLRLAAVVTSPAASLAAATAASNFSSSMAASFCQREESLRVTPSASRVGGSAVAVASCDSEEFRSFPGFFGISASICRAHKKRVRKILRKLPGPIARARTQKKLEKVG